MHHPADLWTRRPGVPAESGGAGLCCRSCGLHRHSLQPLPVSQGRLEVLDSTDSLLFSAGGLHARWLSGQLLERIKITGSWDDVLLLFVFYRGSESPGRHRGPVAQCGAEAGSLAGAHADCGALGWRLPRPYRFSRRSRLPAALSGPAESCVEGLQ